MINKLFNFFNYKVITLDDYENLYSTISKLTLDCEILKKQSNKFLNDKNALIEELTEKEDVIKEIIIDYDDLKNNYNDILQELNDKIDKIEKNKTSLELYCEKQYKIIPNKNYLNKRYVNKKPISIQLNELITPRSFEVMKLKNKIKLHDSDLYFNAKAVGDLVCKSIQYKRDINNPINGMSLNDYYLTPNETIVNGYADCIEEDEEIITIDGLKKAKDIKLGDLVLSFDFEKNKYVYNRIINLWDKGIKPVNEVKFTDGSIINVTDEHHMLIKNKKTNKFEKIDLKDVDLTNPDNCKVPKAIKIPYKPIDIKWLTEDLCFVIGHFLAEGFVDKKKTRVDTCGYEIDECIIPILNKYNIPYTRYKNNSGVPCLRFLKSEFKYYIKTMLNNSFDLGLKKEMLNLPINKLKQLMYGYFIGDGHYHKRKSNTEKIYSTSCERFADQLVHISMKIGEPLYKWKQEKHGGVGTKPIYRLHDYKNMRFRKSHGYDNLSEVRIKYVKPIGKKRTYDWEVENTHNFFFKNGICTAQCEDMSFLTSSLLPELAVAYGFLPSGEGHAYNLFYYKDVMYVLETTGNEAYIVPFDKSKYKLNFIITKHYTYEVNGSVEFGFIANW